VKPETTSENPAPEIKADGENTVPASKVVRFHLCFDQNIVVMNHGYK